MPYDNQSLYNALSELEIIQKSKLDEVLAKSQAAKTPLAAALLDADLISDENLGRTIADILNAPLIRLGNVSIPKDVLAEVPEVVARKQKIIAFKKDKDGLHIGMADPTNFEIKQFLEKKTGLPIKAYYATDRDIDNALYLYSKDIGSTFDDIIQQNIQQAKSSSHSDPPIISIVDTIFSYAYQNKTSDIHIEPFKEESLIRFRIDGVLHDIVSLPINLHLPIITRLKVLSGLRTDEHQAAQDGKLQRNIEGVNVDIRLSIVPIITGERVVMRLLSAKSRQYSLPDLGFSEKDLEHVKKAYEKPYGMVLSTGPTGSGKTTSIYAILKLLNKRDINIMTIEDPVEYDIEGVNHIQVNQKTNLTFAEGLRSIVRQDPDTILVGEIRDQETADIAVNSAMTGHLVLSTLHTNDAATAFPRLLDMGVEPFLIGSTVNVVIGQRLVRKIHESCRVSEDLDVTSLTKYLAKENLKKTFGDKKKITLYKGKGCILDHNTGYSGRIGIFEVLIVDDEIRKAIVGKKDADIIRNIAIKNGMKTMIEDGLDKIKQGLTTFDEVLRVTKE